jgi:hypothetical protein
MGHTRLHGLQCAHAWAWHPSSIAAAPNEASTPAACTRAHAGQWGPPNVAVLFIPGNAGQYTQARGLASESQRQWQKMEKGAMDGRPGDARTPAPTLDWFVVDTMQQLSAFDGAVLVRGACVHGGGRAHPAPLPTAPVAAAHPRRHAAARPQRSNSHCYCTARRHCRRRLARRHTDCSTVLPFLKEPAYEMLIRNPRISR